MNLKPKVMKTQVYNKTRRRNFEILTLTEMNTLFGGKDKYRMKTAKEKDVFNPDEQ